MSAGFLEKVAARAGVSITEVNEVLIKRGIEPDRALRPARRLLITSVYFRGEKDGKATGKFEFNWKDLTPGIWGISSHKNLVGKSSILEIILWALRGTPKRLQSDVRTWLEFVSIDFRVDGEPYTVEFDVKEGVPVGGLFRQVGGIRKAVETFQSDDGFAMCMSHFMMDTFDLDPIPARHDESQTVNHGWLALSSVMYIGNDHNALLGEVVHGGLAGRLLQMFLGLPWARTVMQATTVQKELQFETNTPARAPLIKSADEARERVKQELANAKLRFAQLEQQKASEPDIVLLRKERDDLFRTSLDLEHNLVKANSEEQRLKDQADGDERALRDLREAIVAQTFFSGLKPSCCPRCTTLVDQDKLRREAELMQCSVCSKPVEPADAEAIEEQLEEAQSRLAASRKAVETVRKRNADLRKENAGIDVRLQQARAALDVAVRSDREQAQRQIEWEIASLEGTLRGLDLQIVPVLPPPSDGPIVEAILKESKKDFDSEKEALISSLNGEILRLAHRFGMRQLEEVKLDTSARMSLQKGGQKTHFSYVTPGEKLRLRIATTVALLRVGQEFGIGRHPGLLIIDSPGSEETNELDLATLLQELCAISEELPNLQVFVASALPQAILSALPAEHCLIAKQGDKGHMW